MATKTIATKSAFPHLCNMQEIADDELTVDNEPGPYRGRRLKRRVFGAVLLLLGVLLAIAWWQRESIADRFVESELESRGIKATYTIEEVGLRTQRIRNLVVGDPANPDLSAKLVELDVALNFSGANLRDVRASGVRVKGRFANGKLSFGELDKFADPTSKEPFKWPDIGLVVKDAQVRIDTPWGVIGAGLQGRGLLRNRFVADLSLRAPRIDYGDCLVPDIRFDGDLLMEWRRPRLVGPVSAASATCNEAGLAILRPVLQSDVRLSEKFDKWLGDVRFAASKVNYGEVALTAPTGLISVDGGVKRTNFTLALDRAGFRNKPLTIARLAINAKGYAGWSDGQFGGSAQGDARIKGGALDKGTLGSFRSIAQQARDTPVGPLLARMVPALEGAGDKFDGTLDFDAFRDAEGMVGVTLGSLALNTASGVRVRQSGALVLKNGSGQWGLGSAVDLAIGGRGLPDVKLAMRQSGSQWNGNLVIPPYSAGGASLAVPDIAFRGRPGAAWTFAGNARMTGPLPGGMISGLILPIDGRYDGGSLALYNSCQNIRFDSARISTLTLKGQSLRLCPDRGRSMLMVDHSGNTRFATNIANVTANGMLGSTPISANSVSVRFSLGDGFTARDVELALGESSARTNFDIAILTGQFGDNAITGTLQGGAGQIANVPLLIDEAAGNWRYLNSVLTLDSSLRVLDAAEVDRFQPMAVPNMMLTLENSVLSAIGQLAEPKTGRNVADVDIRHTLGSGAGRALLSVDGLKFDDGLQPEMLTPLTLGVVANVAGTVFGDGRIEWDASGVRSTGRFATRNMNLAAAFGPLEGLTTEIVFTDLLGLETGPAQQAMIASVNPGIPAFNGTISYRLLAGQRVAIEAGRWPFAGGELILDPTILDFGVEKERRLTFRVVGLDAERFLAGYDFQNLRVSGVFDGTLPMIFNQDGGRIVGGALVSRPGGGEVSYLGELAYEDMGTFANFAFNALRSIRYSTLTIGVGGNLDGEIVTDISFIGLQQGSLAKRNFITQQLARIPIQFNVSVKAEFLKLIGSIRGLYDAQYLADQSLPFILDKNGQLQVTAEEAPVKETPVNKDEQGDE
ncbi:MAG: YdbH domain-containing protein [Sphingorhabdus sp.]